MNRMKKVLCSVLAFCMIVTAITVMPQSVQATNSNEDFVIENGVLSEYKGNDEDVIIPDGITRVSDGAFFGCSKIKSVVIPKSVKTIGKRCFLHCDSLKTLTILNKDLKHYSDTFGTVDGEELSNMFDESPIPYEGKRLKEAVKTYKNSTLTIIGYKNSTAQELARELAETSHYWYSVVKFKDISTKKITKYGVKIPTYINLKKKKSKVLKIKLPNTMKRVSKFKANDGYYTKSVKILFKSNNKKVATVNSKGTITGKKKGIAIITVTIIGAYEECNDGARKTFTTKVTVK